MKIGYPCLNYSIDCSSQEEGEKKAKHVSTLDEVHFKKIFLEIKKTNIDLDIMLEIKDKEYSFKKFLNIL